MASREEKSLKIYGLHTYADVFSATPEGSFSLADNVVIDQNNTISPRRGFSRLTNDISDGTTLTVTDGKLFNIKGKIHFQTSSGSLYYYDEDKLWWVSYDEEVAPPTTANSSRTAVANQNVYITTNQGVQKISALGASVVDSGAPEALPPSLSDLPAGSLFSGVDDQVAYRVVWGYKDVNQNLILGAPSQRLVVASQAGSTTAELKILIPNSVDTNWFYQIYRSETTTGGTTPSDILYLAYEGNPTQNNIDGIDDLIYTDNRPEELLGSPLYTNSTQEGALAANYEAPQCNDIALFQGHVFYANTVRKQELIIQLYGTGGDGLQNSDIITIEDSSGSIDYTADDSITGTDTFSGTNFRLYDTGDFLADVENTAKALIDAINNNASSNVIAYYWSELSTTSIELPGEIRLVEKDYGDTGGEFTVTATSPVNGSVIADIWSPDLTNGALSEAETKPNRIYYSKFQEPEAVPVTNFFDVGPANQPIKRIVALRTSLLVFTEEAIYRLTGTTQAAFQVNLLDNTAKLMAEDSLVTFNNNVYGLFDQGVCAVGETVKVISRPIEGELLEIFGEAVNNLNEIAFGVGYESDRKYILYVPTTATSTQANKAYVYNTVTRSWTTWNKSSVHGVVGRVDDRLYLLGSSFVSRERKNFNEQDIADEGLATTTTAVSGTEITVGSVTNQTEVGYFYYESPSKFSKILSVDTNSGKITVQDDLDWGTNSLSKVASGVQDAFTLTLDSVPTETIVAGASITGTGVPSDTKIVSVDADVITLNRALTSDATDETYTITQNYEILPFISVEVRWNPIYMNSPAVLKQFSETTLLTTSALEEVVLGFKGITSGAYEDISFSTTAIAPWGLFEWGNATWGGESSVLRYRTYVPREKQRDSALFPRVKVDTIFNNFEISGLSIIYRMLSSRTVR